MLRYEVPVFAELRLTRRDAHGVQGGPGAFVLDRAPKKRPGRLLRVEQYQQPE
jgi:hypothetical protein